MQLSQLKAPRGANKRKKLVGRGSGSGHGKTSCRGQTGQNARSGRGILNSLEGGQMPLIRRLPKVGFRSRRPVLYQLVRVEQLNCFKAGSVVDAEALKEKGLLKSRNKPYKILGEGDLERKLTVKACAFSKSAVEKINKAGGKTEPVVLASFRLHKNNGSKVSRQEQS